MADVLEPVARLSRDLRKASVTLSESEARFLVDSYYQMQENRIRAAGQIRSIGENEPHAVLSWLFEQNRVLEQQLKGALQRYADSTPVGEWAQSIVGIGPVITAGLLAHIDIEKAPTVGHIWKFAGLVPGQRAVKGERRSWNAQLKTLTWKIGESFVKVSGNKRDVYGKIYVARKELEQERNEAGEFADQAAKKLETTRIGKSTEAYKHYSEGRLPPGHIHARAKRYAVKLFLAHLHEVWYVIHFGKMPPNPYVIEHLGHADKFDPPNFDHSKWLRE